MHLLSLLVSVEGALEVLVDTRVVKDWCRCVKAQICWSFSIKVRKRIYWHLSLLLISYYNLCEFCGMGNFMLSLLIITMLHYT